MRILNILNHLPYPPTSGAPLRSYNVVRRLAKGNEVYLACFRSTDRPGEDVAYLRGFCQDVVTVKYRSLKKAVHIGKAVKALLDGEPPELRLAFSEELAAEIRNLVKRVRFDVVQIEHGSMGLYLEVLPQSLRRRTVWLLHDVDFDKFKHLARIESRTVTRVRYWLHATMMRRWQPRFASHFGLCMTMSDADRQTLLATNRELKVEISPNGVDTHLYQPLPDAIDGSELLFIGNMSYQPNIDAAIYFCREVLPLIRKKVPDAKLWIVGINPDPSIKRLEHEGVVVTGSVVDVVPFYQRSKVCVVPLRAGSGTRLKVLEAMALGRCVVSTSLGCEGLEAVDGEHVLIADDCRRFADRVVQVLGSESLRTEFTGRARAFVVQNYDWDVITRKSAIEFENLICQQSEIGNSNSADDAISYL